MNLGKPRLSRRPGKQGHITWNVRKLCWTNEKWWTQHHSLPPQGKLWSLPPPPQIEGWAPHWGSCLALPIMNGWIRKGECNSSSLMPFSIRKWAFLKYLDMVSYPSFSVSGASKPTSFLQTSQWTQGPGVLSSMKTQLHQNLLLHYNTAARC